jgi:hypothetical protein
VVGATSIPWADSNTICARRHVTTDPDDRRTILRSRWPSSLLISLTRMHSRTTTSLSNSVAQADSSSELSCRIPGDDVENSGPAPSQGCNRPAGPASHEENTMAKYLLLKHYRGAPAPVNDVPMDQWRPDEVEAHIRFMNDFAARLESSGEFIDGQALSPDGVWVRYDGEGRPPVTDGPFAETKDLIAGWMVIDVDSYERAIELAGELSAAPGAGGEPIHEWLEVRPFLAAPPTVTQ